ncbi:MAG: LysE family translocator [Chloroflexi bacterium]|nr:LysE family translocator [Chloroflexota bacterium]MCI0580563.1 LysE family translocator [Chloroflexota bacterium]MCI0647595.1 LysE family translocator [Chloroflexota bacterium]MCI0730672.1 LysE family translocator [Chloroflexota bacterium]
MPEFSTLLIFLAAALALLVIPGPAVLYIVARSVDQGRLAGVVSVLGIATGSLFHIAAAALGLSALLMSSATLFLGVKYLGAAYLIYLGVRQLLVKKEFHQLEVKGSRKLARVFYQGVLVNVLNPKTALFFFAFLPQFVDVNKGAASTQILFLGALFTVMGLCSDGLYALLAGTAGRWLKRNTGVLSAQRYFAGTIYLLLGVTTALSGSGRAK